MDSQRREQAHNSLRYARGNHGDRLVLAQLGIDSLIETARELLDGAPAQPDL